MRPTRTRRLLERVTTTGGLEVDRDTGIIRGVKVLGLTSENKRRYTPEAVARAKGLYEGIHVNIDHPERGSKKDRSSYDRFGKLVNVRLGRDGLYADLLYLKSHPLAESIAEAAERMPDLFGLSHNAEGEGRMEGGVFVVESITDVRHVDLVADPATTRSLAESRNSTMKRKISELVNHSHPPLREAAKRLLEADPMMGDMEMDAPADDVAPEPAAEGDWKQDLVQAIGKLVSSEDPADHDTAKKIMAMLKPASAVDVSGDVAADVEEAEDDDEEDDDKDTMESVRREVQTLRRQLEVRELCEAAGIRPDKTLAAILERCQSKAEILEVLAREKKHASYRTPRSQGYGLTESQAGGRAASDAKSLIAALRN